ncbi:virulence RhuM family protein [Desulfatibacillum aliphaticivorans]|uniref:virulence RhuM family protein n=1 Tax=Desulfatibacillum aliphaticivorans TaxID=218208 RepID=UPI00041D9F15|nr:virulence RhuM family protein [Desulfatibacillum aliphaticivorans]
MTDNHNLPALPDDPGEFLLYQTDDHGARVDVRLHQETVWLSLNQMASLFQRDKSVISRHIRSVFEEGELNREATVAKFATVQTEGTRKVERQIEFFNLDVIISVGYRVKSLRGTQFRMWATQKLKEYMVKGFVMDDERLKNPPVKDSAVPDYFDEMLERIRDIRASERRMYLRVREIFAMAGDYDPSWSETTKYFSIIQNKLHYAATGMTAPELIKSRADHMASNMGLTTWKGGEVRKTDVTIAKNYLDEKEIEELNRIVVMWLDFAEDQARRRRQIFMKDWEMKLDDFLIFNERKVLPNAGKVTKKAADNHARAEYDKFEARRREYKESLGESNYVRQLEEAAKMLPAGKGKTKK